MSVCVWVFGGGCTYFLKVLFLSGAFDLFFLKVIFLEWGSPTIIFKKFIG